MVMQQVAQWIHLRMHHDRDPNIGSHPGLASLKHSRCYAHNGVGVLVDFNRLAYDVRRRTEMRLPETVADHHHRRATRLLVLHRKKSTPQDRPHAQYIEIIRRGYHAPHALRFTLARQAQLSEAAGHYARKTLLPVAHGFDVGICKREGIVAGLAQRHGHDLAGVGKPWNWVQ